MEVLILTILISKLHLYYLHLLMYIKAAKPKVWFLKLEFSSVFLMAAYKLKRLHTVYVF